MDSVRNKSSLLIFFFNGLIFIFLIKKGSRKCVKKPKLTATHINSRLKFCNYWINNKNDMSRIVFVDEKTFTGTPIRSKYSLRRIGESFDEKHIDFVANSGLSVNEFAHIGKNILKVYLLKSN